MEYLWAWGTLIHEKNLRSEISCQTPFKVMSSSSEMTKQENHFQLFPTS